MVRLRYLNLFIGIISKQMSVKLIYINKTIVLYIIVFLIIILTVWFVLVYS